MNKEKMLELIDKENGRGFSNNISLDGYNFYKENSFICFKITKVEGINIVNIRYLYAENNEELISILAYACNFWMGNKIKFIYYKEKQKRPYVIKSLDNLGFKILSKKIVNKWKHEFECINENGNCTCPTIEAHS